MSEPLLKPDWKLPPNVRAVVTRRSGAGASVGPFARFNLGDRVGDEAAQANRRELVGLAQLPAEPAWLRQEHGVAVHEADAIPLAEPPLADASIARAPGVVLAVCSADCLPLLLCADDGAEIAAVHAGWRGLAAGVIEATIARLRAPRISAYLGPAIGPEKYEVGAEVRAAFVDRDAAAAAAFRATRPGHWHCDLYALARLRLKRLGIERVAGGTLCTASDPASFFSHRRDGLSGRMASLIWRTA